MEIKLFDIHAHTNFTVFDDDRDAVIARARDEGIGIINVGTKFETTKKAIEMAEQYDTCWAIAGLHPIHTDASWHDTDEIGSETKPFESKGEVFNIDAYREIITASKRVVGIGETGLDYFRTTPESVDKQRAAFIAQIELAIELDLPLMLHVRPSRGSMDAYYDVIAILAEYKQKAGDRLRGDAHFFAGDQDVAQKFLDLGFDLSFTGVVTFAPEYAEVIRFVPIDRIHVETDCPYVAPMPHRGERNEPIFVIETAKKIAEIKGIAYDDLIQQLRTNTQRLFAF